MCIFALVCISAPSRAAKGGAPKRCPPVSASPARSARQKRPKIRVHARPLTSPVKSRTSATLPGTVEDLPAILEKRRDRKHLRRRRYGIQKARYPFIWIFHCRAGRCTMPSSRQDCSCCSLAHGGLPLTTCSYTHADSSMSSSVAGPSSLPRSSPLWSFDFSPGSPSLPAAAEGSGGAPSPPLLGDEANSAAQLVR